MIYQLYWIAYLWFLIEAIRKHEPHVVVLAVVGAALVSSLLVLHVLVLARREELERAREWRRAK